MLRKTDRELDISNMTKKFGVHIEKLKKNYKEKLHEKKIDFNDTIFNKILLDTIKDMGIKYDNKSHSPDFYDTGIQNMKKTSDIIEKTSIMRTVFSFHINLYHTLAFQVLGDTIGYNNGKWEFNYDQRNPGFEYTNELIYEYIDLGGLIELDLTGWLRSDDSIMYQTTFEVLLEKDYDVKNIDDFGETLQKKYIEIMQKMENRHPGNTVMRSLNIQKNIKWDTLPYSSEDIGSGASMRSGCIGLFYCGEHNRHNLIALATECARITHNSAIAIYGSIVSALFTAYAIERIDINHWPSKFIELYKSGIVDEYIKKSRPHEYEQFNRDKILFYGQWEKYVTMRFTGRTPRSDLKMFKNPVLRIKYFAENFSKGHIDFPGANSDDSVIIAYDSVMTSKTNVEKNIIYSILHIGDSDTIGSIAMSWQRAYYNNLPIYNLMQNALGLLENYSDIEKIFINQKSFEKSYDLFMENIFNESFDKNMRDHYKIISWE